MKRRQTKYYKSVAEFNQLEKELQKDIGKYAKYKSYYSTEGAKQGLINNGTYSYRKTKQNMQG